MITFSYFTNRMEPKIEWFFDSLIKQTREENLTGFGLTIVDFHKDVRPINIPPELSFAKHVKPKPTVWQGDYRLTNENYFAPSNTRNTAICICETPYIALIDDLSVLMPGWLKELKSRLNESAYILGAYKKVKNLVVENGEVKSFEPFPQGVDSRWDAGSDYGPVVAAGSWAFGCSLAGPVEGFLRINGYDEDCDSMGGEDYIAGMMLERNGYRFSYSRKMLTLESEERHHVEKPFKRIIKKTPMHPIDASHIILEQVMSGGRIKAQNYFGSIRDLRSKVLAGEDFPTNQIPEHDWRDGQPLREM